MADIWMDVDSALSEVPVNIMPLIDDTDFKTIEASVAYNAAGMALKWNFVTTAGAYTQTAVTPTTGGDYDWAHQGGGMYSIEIPASGGASINNDTEGFGWFTGVCTGVLPWRGPVIGFRKASMNNIMVNNGTLQDNLEDMFDGTGYVGGTAKLGVDVVVLHGDATAAENAEKVFDNTGYAMSNSSIGSASGSSVSGIADAVWDEVLTSGHAVGNSAAAILSGILEDTGTTLPGTLATIAGYIDTEIGDIKAQTDQLVFVSGDVKATLDGETVEITRPTGAVVADAGNTASTFKTNLSGTINDMWVVAYIKFTSGNLINQVRKITGYNGTTKFITVLLAFSEAPGGTDTFELINE